MTGLAEQPHGVPGAKKNLACRANKPEVRRVPKRLRITMCRIAAPSTIATSLDISVVPQAVIPPLVYPPNERLLNTVF
jgi:hypothetical protein